MEHENLEKKTSTVPMLRKEEKEVALDTPNSVGVGKILIREDTILANLPGCAVCGKGQFACARVKNQWSVLCWGKQSEKNYYCILVILSFTFVLSLIGTIFLCFTNGINDAILSNMVIRNNSIAYSMWKHPNVQPTMRVFLFNYTNWEEVKYGMEPKLKVQEVGPYSYSQDLERVNVRFEKDKVIFQEKSHFVYLPEKSAGPAFDKVVVPNLPLLGVVSKAVSLNLHAFAQVALQSSLRWADHPEPFVKLPVHRFLWGYDDTIIAAAKPFLTFLGQLKFEKFGLLAAKNNTFSETFTVNTGQDDMDKMNLIERVDGHDHLPYWGSPECNSLQGTDGSIFPPSQLDRKTVLHVFYPNLCRRLPFVYEKDVETPEGITLLRYRMPLDVFDDPKRNPANQCYCEIDSGTCPPKGVINVTECAMGAPALISFPHFYLGDEKLREDVEGLHPDPIKHDSYVDIHPTLGIALNGKSSLQINIQVRKSPSFNALHFLEEGLVLPVAWIEMSVQELPESVKSLVYHGTYSTAAAQLGLTVISIITLIISSICLFVILIRKKRRPCATIKISVDPETKNQNP
ncbi:hypothetical protein K1T71_000897 [Dendrolimus kikuchii]|uniref:Uncharacterized protein n=1 Tax=Dendrolimus kikuchii TaxID=765133 RepID=A0ACC1DGA7_9NEOP|nr:hypothetical protein K1T71_000897 [Dendrolimus kikuchii]